MRPAAGWLAVARLAPSRVRPVHLTVCGLLAATAAAAVLVLRPNAAPVAAAMVLAAWFFDRADGLLARASKPPRPGRWLDANVDELVDVALQIAVAAAAATLTGSALPWALLIAFLVGKYLLVCGLALEETDHEGQTRSRDSDDGPASGGWLRRVYHLPGNADVRVHLLVLALVTGWLTAELALVAAYYNLRWIVRYVLVFRRLGGKP